MEHQAQPSFIVENIKLMKMYKAHTLSQFTCG